VSKKEEKGPFMYFVLVLSDRLKLLISRNKNLKTWNMAELRPYSDLYTQMLSARIKTQFKGSQPYLSSLHLQNTLHRIYLLFCMGVKLRLSY